MNDYSIYQDEELIRRLHAGEEGIADYLLEKYKPFVKSKSRALFLVGGDREDLIQEGMTAKLVQMPEDVRSKFRGTLTRIVNDGANGLICLIL